MPKTRAQYISVSRRTDIPRFFHETFFTAWRERRITYATGYGRTYTVSLDPEDVLGYIFWSKDFGPFLEDPRLTALLRKNNAIFHYTVNDCPDLEPRVAPLPLRLENLARLSDLAGPRRVLWRFDPICRYETPDGRIHTNHGAFFRLLPVAARLGLTRCYFSFMDFYPKLDARRMRFRSFSPDEKSGIAKEMGIEAARHGLRLFNCADPEIADKVPGVEPAHCVDDGLLAETDRFGVHRALKARPTRQGCGCFESRDVGSYHQTCPHGCLYCYANPRRI